MPTLAKNSNSSRQPPGSGTSGPRSLGSSGKLGPPTRPMVGWTPAAALAAMPRRPGTSRWVKVIVPTLPAGISRPPAAAVAPASGARPPAAAPIVRPAVVPRKRRRLRALRNELDLDARIVLLLETGRAESRRWRTREEPTWRWPRADCTHG